MSDLGSANGFDGWIKRAERRMRTIEGALGRGRVPRVCFSTARPNPATVQPGVRYFELDTNRSIVMNADQTAWIYADSGAPAGGSTGTAYTDEQAQDAAAAMIAAGSHTGISFAYDDAGNRLSATVTATGGGGTNTSTTTVVTEYLPESYGAVANGSTDDSGAIQSAINAASGASNGGSTRVKLQTGKSYRIKATLMMKANVELDLNGATLQGPITGYGQITSSNNPAVPAGNDLAGQIAGAAISDTGGLDQVIYGVKIRNGILANFRYGVLTACASWAYPLIYDLTFLECNIGVFTYQGAQQMRLFGCRSDGQAAGTTYVGSATGFVSGHPYAGQDNYFTDQFLYDGGYSSDRDKSYVNATFDAWFSNAILRPGSSALSARFPNGNVYGFAPSDDACQVSGRNIYIPQRNGRITFHPQIRTLHSQNTPRGVALIANPANIDMADIGGEGMFQTGSHSMVQIISNNGVNPSGVFRNIDAYYIDPGTATYAVETRNAPNGGVDTGTKMFVGMNLSSNGTGKVNAAGQWTLLP